MKVTLLQYYRGFGSLYGALAAIPFIPPLTHVFTPDSTKFAYLYPPLGDIQILALAFTFIFLVIVTFAVFAYCQAGKVRPAVRPSRWLLGAILSLFLLIGMYVFFVRLVAVPSVNQQVLVSIGYQRTEFASKTYPTSSDWDILHDQGPSEESIQHLWTPFSVWIVRGTLLLVYTAMLACFLVVICAGVYQHASDVAAVELKLPKAQGERPS